MMRLLFLHGPAACFVLEDWPIARVASRAASILEAVMEFTYGRSSPRQWE